MTKLHFQPIRDKAPYIIDTILQTEELASLGSVLPSIHLVTEELVVNVASYAYPDGADDYLDVDIIRDEERITLRFRDGGMPFNPLEREAPDTTLPIEERPIGGLGIYLVRQFMDTVEYEYTNGENILTVMKKV
jgi:anti-sigma regulatory factor (Ser/Thr protein kinase)